MTTFRSGSTPIHSLLSAYLNQTSGIVSLDAYFDLWEFGYKETANGIEMRPYRESKLGPKDFKKLPLKQPRTLVARLELLKRYHQKYFIKCNPIEGDVMDWLLDHYDFIFTERLDLPAQIVSYQISCGYGRWYKRSGLFLERRSLTARRDWFTELEVSLSQYFMLKSYLPSAPVLTYESFAKLTPRQFLKQAGLTRVWNPKLVTLTAKQNHDDFDRNLAVFKNRSEIAKWYKSSLLQTIRPWPV